MPKITVTASVHRTLRGFQDVVIVVIAGRPFTHCCSSPEEARALVESTAKELGMWKTSVAEGE